MINHQVSKNKGSKIKKVQKGKTEVGRMLN
jgi:hypothetical protein